MRCAKCGSPICCTRASRSRPTSTARRCCGWRSQTGRLSVTNKDDGGALAAGEPADILVLDWDAVDAERLRADLDPCDLLFARTTMRHIHELIVGGRTVVRDGQVLGIDLPGDARRAAGAAARQAWRRSAPLAAALRELERAVAAHYQAEAPCC